MAEYPHLEVGGRALHPNETPAGCGNCGLRCRMARRQRHGRSFPPSMLLLAKELREDDDAQDRRQALNGMLQHMSFHVSSVHREPRK